MSGKVDFSAALKEAERSGLVSSGDFFKVKEGVNRIRLVGGPLPHRGDYKGTPNFKWLCYIIDRTDGAIKPYFMAHTIFKLIRDLQTSEDYAFEGVPMPYDMTIGAKGAGTKEVEYSVVPAKKETPLTKDELDDLASKKPLADLQSNLRAKAMEREAYAPVNGGHFDPDEIPV